MLTRVINKINQLRGHEPVPADEGPVPKEYVAGFLPANPVVVEAGAFDGSDTLQMARQWPTGHIHAFEPVPGNFAELQRRTKGLRNVTTYNMGLGDRNGELDLHLSGGMSKESSSFLPPKEHLRLHPKVDFGQVVKARMTTLDQWAQDQRAKAIDFLWLDMQGYEPLALRSATTALKSVRAILTEINLVEMYAGAVLYPEYKAFLMGQGFVVEREHIPDSVGLAFFIRKGS